MISRTALIGAALGAGAILAQSFDLPASPEGFGVLVGRMIGGALVGAFVARVVMARFSGPG